MRTARLGAALTVCLGLLAVSAGPAAAEFGIASFTNQYVDPVTAEPATQAGSHADVVTDLQFDTVGAGSARMDGQVRDIQVDLPAGFYGNPQVARTCSMEDIVVGDGICERAAQVGVLNYEVAPGTFIDFPVYNLPSPDEQTAVLGVLAVSVPAKIVISARTDGDYGLTANLTNLNQALALTKTKLTLWGVPADPIHDPQRFNPGDLFPSGGPAEMPERPFLSMPPRCGPVTTTLKAASWQNPDVWHTATYTSPPLDGCENLGFAPTLKARPTTDAADSPSGLDAELQMPYSEDPKGLAEAHLKRAEVTLPAGLVINPSGANGLDGCTPAQIGLTTPVGAGSPHFDKSPAQCPDAARIGTVESTTPALADPLKGSVYAATPGQNPFGNLLTVYMVMEGKGLVIKIAGKVTADSQTGRLSAVFDEIPQFPFDLKMSLFGGAYGVLRTPPTCGAYATTGTLTPWTAPTTPSVEVNDKYAISQGAGGQGCASSEDQLPNRPGFGAASTSALAGSYQPFVIDLKREDGSQQFSAVTVSPPPGLVAKLAGTATCSDAALAAAAGKSGNAEKSSPSCPAASKVGEVWAAAGAGPAPYNAPGKVYLAGPYKGAPLSFAFVVPAAAGPYDLGTVITRAAVFVDPLTAQVKTVSDPLPQILEGIPLDVRSISVRLDKPDFTLNPTSCDPTSVNGSLLSGTGALASLIDRFQVGECERLKFKPKLSISLKGKTRRTGNPALTAVLKMPSGQANIAKTTVVLPQSMFIDNSHISNPCTRVQFDAGRCPKGSILGKATAFSPLLDEPLRGPVYFRSNGGDRELPDLVADLDGQIHLTLVGFIDSVKTGPETARVRTRFLNVPDAPVSKFVLKMAGGRKGLLENSVNLCGSSQTAEVQMEAHNAKTAFFDQPLGTSCGGKKKQRKR